MYSRPSNFFITLLAAGLATSQSFSNLGLSSSCQSALSAAAGNQELSNCLNLLPAIALVETTANTSIIPNLNTWLIGFCGANACNTATLSAAVNNITTGCSSDLQTAGVGVSGVEDVANQIVQLYPTIRNVLCLEDSSKSQLCITELLNDVESSLGKPLSINTLEQIPSILADQGSGLSLSGSNSTSSIPKNVTCSSCSQAAWSLVKNDIAQYTSITPIENVFTQECGASFTANTTSLPSNVVEGTGSAAPKLATTNTPSGATGLVLIQQGFLGTALASMFAITTGFVLIL